MNEELKKGIPKAIVIGELKFTKEEKERHARDIAKAKKKLGILDKNESNKDDKSTR